MFRRLMILAVAAAAFAVLAQSALGVNVRVRVEGKTQTIYGMAEPTLSMPGTNALDALEAASARGEFYYHVTQFSFGPFVDQIGRFRAEGSNGWAFKVNGASPPVGANNVVLRDGDVVLWYWSTFSEQGGSPTLELRASTTAMGCRPLPRPPRACNSTYFRAFLVDDRGRRTQARDVTFTIDRRRIRSRAGEFRFPNLWREARVTKVGAVRSALVVNPRPRG